MLVHLAPTFPPMRKFEHIRVRMFEDFLPTQNSRTMLKFDTIAISMIYPWISQNVFTFILCLMLVELYMHKKHLQPWICQDHFHHMMHQGPSSQSLLKLDMLVFQLLWLWIGNKDGTCYMWSTLLWTFTSNMTQFFTIQTKIIYTSKLFLLLCEGLESCLVNLHGIILQQGCRRLG